MWVVKLVTVGAQSIASGHIGDNISQKNEIFENLVLHKIKMSTFSSRFLNKKSHFHLSKWKIIMSQKVVFYFFFEISTFLRQFTKF
jgi:hypothetical protein